MELRPAPAQENLADAQQEKLTDAHDCDGDAAVGPWASGQARCVACGHEWVAAAPSDAADLECPSCHLERGQFKYPFIPKAGSAYRDCSCGGNLFHLIIDAGPEDMALLNTSGGLALPHYLMCAACGKTATF